MKQRSLFCVDLGIVTEEDAGNKSNWILSLPEFLRSLFHFYLKHFYNVSCRAQDYLISSQKRPSFNLSVLVFRGLILTSPKTNALQKSPSVKHRNRQYMHQVEDKYPVLSAVCACNR